MRKILALHLCDDLQGRHLINGSVQSAFDRAINFLFQTENGPRIFTILKDGLTLMPDSILVSEELFSEIMDCRAGSASLTMHEFTYAQIQLKFRPEMQRILFLPQRMNQGETDLSMLKRHLQQLNKFTDREEKGSDMKCLPVKYQIYAAEFAAALLEENREKSAAAFFHMVGAGKGLTPACDDAAIGIMAVVCTCFIKKYKDHGAGIFHFLTKEMRFLLQKEKYTTQISSKYLKCACQGYFSELLCQLMEWLFSSDSVFPETLLEQITNIGHSSGFDMLYGVQTAIGGVIDVSLNYY